MHIPAPHHFPVPKTLTEIRGCRCDISIPMPWPDPCTGSQIVQGESTLVLMVGKWSHRSLEKSN